MPETTTLLLIAAGCFGALAAWRLLTLRFPHPVDFATVSVLYYSLPLALLSAVIGDDSGKVLLHAAAADPHIARQSVLYALIACISIYSGMGLAKLIGNNSTRLHFRLQLQDILKTQFFSLGLLALIVLGIVLFGPAEYFAGYNVDSREDSASSGTALIYTSIEMLGLIIGYSYIISRALHRLVNVKMIAVIVLSLVLLAAARGKRLEVMSAFLPLIILVFATYGVFRTVRGRLLLVLTAALAISMLASLRFGELPTAASIAFNLVSEGLFAGHSLPGVIERLSAGQIEYEYGARIGAGFLAVIPRFIWPSKDELLYAGDEALKELAPLGATNILTEVVLQGGTLAVILWFVILGFIFERLYRSLRGFDAAIQSRRMSAGTIAYLVVMCAFIPHFRDGMVPAMKICLQVMLFFFAIAGCRLLPLPTWIMLRAYSKPRAGAERRDNPAVNSSG